MVSFKNTFSSIYPHTQIHLPPTQHELITPRSPSPRSLVFWELHNPGRSSPRKSQLSRGSQDCLFAWGIIFSLCGKLPWICGKRSCTKSKEPMTIFQRFFCVSVHDQPISLFDQMLILFLFLLFYIIFGLFFICWHVKENTPKATNQGWQPTLPKKVLKVPHILYEMAGSVDDVHLMSGYCPPYWSSPLGR